MEKPMIEAVKNETKSEPILDEVSVDDARELELAAARFESAQAKFQLAQFVFAQAKPAFEAMQQRIGAKYRLAQGDAVDPQTRKITRGAH
jgi:hypothetical protein